MIPRAIVILAASLLLLGGSPDAFASDRPQSYGFAPAIPKKIPTFDMKRPARPGRGMLQVELSLQVSKKGKVTGVKTDTPEGAAVARALDSYLSAVKFEPARLDGKKIAASAPVVVSYDDGSHQPQLRFAVSKDKAVDDPFLYFLALRLNGIEPPSVKSFPSYFCRFDRDDTLAAYPCVALRLDLDETGAVQDASIAMSTLPGIDGQLLSSVQYAEFATATVDGVPTAGPVWLLISLFPTLSYPTLPYPVSSPGELERVAQDLRLRLFPDTLGVMTGPMPRERGFDRFTGSATPIHPHDTIVAVLTFDSTGLLIRSQIERAAHELVSLASLGLSRTTFFPALGFDGRPRPFVGTARFLFDGSTTVRIRYDWLRQP